MGAAAINVIFTGYVVVIGMQAVNNINLKEVVGSAIGGGIAKGLLNVGSGVINATNALVSTVGKSSAVNVVNLAESNLLKSVVEPTLENFFEGKLGTPQNTGGGGKQTLPTMVAPDPTAGGLFANPNSLCFTCTSNYNSGAFSNQGGKMKF